LTSFFEMAHFVLLMTALVLAPLAKPSSAEMNHNQVGTIGSEVVALVRADDANPIVSLCQGELYFAQSTLGSRSGNVAAGMLQLAFRDAVTFVGGAEGPIGGPDGCVDLTHDGNGGLAATVDLLDCVHSHSAALGLGGAFSRADLWALAGTAAVVAAMPSESIASVALRFRSGRQDAADCSTADVGRYPNPEGGLDSVLAVFETRLGFTKREIVALMGAHSIGRARMHNSGYAGAWLHNIKLQALNGPQYYQSLLGYRWAKHRSGGTSSSNAPLFQWEHGGIRSHIMLSTDMALVYDMADAQVAGKEGGARESEAVQCGPALAGAVARPSSHDGGRSSPCTAAVTRSVVEEYAQETSGQALWARDFAFAFAKLVELGSRTLGPASIISINSLRPDAASGLLSAPVAQDGAVPIERGASSVFKIVVPVAAGVVLAGVAILVFTVLRHQSRRVTTVGRVLLPSPVAPVTTVANLKASVVVAWAEPDEGASVAAHADADRTAVSRCAVGGLAAMTMKLEAADVDERSVPLSRAIDTYLGVWSLDGIGDRSRSASRFVAND
jgi:hypothetical protein